MTDNKLLMTEGSVCKKIFAFAVPIFLGNLFQQLYNVVDALIVGNYVGKEALAAISSTGALIFLIVGLFGGIFSGAGVVIARYVGAGDEEKVRRAIHTSVAFGLAAGILITLIGTFLAPQMLRLMGTPEEVVEEALIYLSIYFGGILTIVMYNTASGIFQAVGDSKRPLKFLCIAAISNVILDLVFVVVFNMGTGGAALATVIAQGISACLAFSYLMRTKEIYKVSIRHIKVDWKLLGEVLRLGIPSGVQNSVIALANVVVQSNINAFGAIAVAGSGAYLKIEGFAFIPITSFAMSMTVFISQNLGAGQYKRAKKGTYFGLGVCMLLAQTVGVLFYLGAPQLIAMFNNNPEVVAHGTLQARTVALFYFLLAFSHCMAGILRGAGKSIIPMLVMLIFWCFVRVTYITVGTYFVEDVRIVFSAYPLTWSLSSIVFMIYYLKSNWLYTFKEKKIEATA